MKEKLTRIKEKIKSRKKLIRIVSISIATVVLMIWGAGIFLSIHYEKIVRKKINENLPAEWAVEFSSFQIKLLNRSVEIKNLKLTHTPDTTRIVKNTVEIRKIAITGIHLIELLRNGAFVINETTFDQGVVNFHRLTKKKDSLEAEEVNNSFLKKLSINNLHLRDFKIYIYADTIQELESNLNVRFTNIELASLDYNDISIENGETLLTDIIYTPINSFYTTTAHSIRIPLHKNVSIDSIRINPIYKKFEFARKLGKQTDRFDVTIPKIEIVNWDLQKLTDSIFQASTITIHSPELTAFRDKRLPFIKDHFTLLPATILHNSPLRIDLDTLYIKNAAIAYEEFSEKNNKSGTLRFSHLKATALNITNIDSLKKGDHIHLHVNTKVMESGSMIAHFEIPYNPNSLYVADGALSNLNLITLNDVLESLAMVRIESGEMKSFKFHFAYDEIQSNGAVELNYENLHVAALQEKDDNTTVNEIKSFLVNTFIIKKTKDETTPIENRTGEIYFNRDRKRSIFNYWWKSVFTGIKSSYNLDKLPLARDNEDKSKEKERKKKQKESEKERV